MLSRRHVLASNLLSRVDGVVSGKVRKYYVLTRGGEEALDEPR